jgi:hypothetical protein
VGSGLTFFEDPGIQNMQIHDGCAGKFQHICREKPSNTRNLPAHPS